MIRKRAHRATVERFRALKLHGDLNTRERAKLPCGCAIYVGISTETRRAATAGQACSEKHGVLIELASALLAARLQTPNHKKLMVDLCAEVLGEAAATV